MTSSGLHGLLTGLIHSYPNDTSFCFSLTQSQIHPQCCYFQFVFKLQYPFLLLCFADLYPPFKIFSLGSLLCALSLFSPSILLRCCLGLLMVFIVLFIWSHESLSPLDTEPIEVRHEVCSFICSSADVLIES